MVGVALILPFETVTEVLGEERGHQGSLIALLDRYPIHLYVKVEAESPGPCLASHRQLVAKLASQLAPCRNAWRQIDGLKILCR